MKKFAFLCAAVLGILFCGCASSGRMTRMSGGVLDEYSAPPSYRIRSQKFQHKSTQLDSTSRFAKNAVGGLDASLVNIWPFFFRSDAYWSVLWPMIDYDPYGLAIRPFYNQEGDEYSILFPLSAWNPENKDGWLLNFAWNRKGFGFIPLTWHSSNESDGVFYYTPLLIHSWDHRSLSWQRNDWSRNDRFTSALLGFYVSGRKIMQGEWSWLYSRKSLDNNPNFAAELNYRLAGSEWPVPVNNHELNLLKDRIFQELPLKKGLSYGFFPLFHYTRSPDDSTWFRMFLYICGTSSSERTFQWDIYNRLLALYRADKLEPAYKSAFGGGKNEFFSIALMSRFCKVTRYSDEGKFKIFRDLQQYDKRPFSQRLPEIREKLAALDPNLKLPETVTTAQTFNLFLKKWAKDKEFPTYTSYAGGVLPLFWYDYDRNYQWWFSPALLTRYSTNNSGSNFWSLPLLTYVDKKKNSDISAVLPPVIWYSKTVRNERIHRKILPRTEKWASGQQSEKCSDYAGLGLFYHGKELFYVAKNGLDAKNVEFIRSNIFTLSNMQKKLEKDEQTLAKETRQNEQWKTKNKIEHYRKLIREEELKEQQKKINTDKLKLSKSLKEVEQKCSSIGFQFNASVLNDRAKVEQEVNRFFDQCAEIRWQEDFGNGFFYRKELFHNGDYKWRFLGFLAGGEKDGNRESTHILHLLYRDRKEKQRSETLFFPFVSIQKDGEDTRFSFLWRVFQYGTQKGKSGGYFMFIPF